MFLKTDITAKQRFKSQTKTFSETVRHERCIMYVHILCNMSYDRTCIQDGL